MLEDTGQRHCSWGHLNMGRPGGPWCLHMTFSAIPLNARIIIFKKSSARTTLGYPRTIFGLLRQAWEHPWPILEPSRSSWTCLGGHPGVIWGSLAPPWDAMGSWHLTFSAMPELIFSKGWVSKPWSVFWGHQHFFLAPI